MSLRAQVEASHRQGNRVMVAMFLLVSLPCLLGAGYMTARSLGYVFGAERAPGRIVEISGGTPELTVEYTTNTGQNRKVRSFGSDLYANYAVGDAVGVYYEPRNPASARLDLFAELWMLPMILGLFGSFFFVPVLMIGGEVLRGFRLPVRRIDLDVQGQTVQAEYTGFRFEIDSQVLRRRPGGMGSVSITSAEGKHLLIDNGRPRDPLDPLVQRELGLRFVVQARWTEPRTGTEHEFESEPQTEDPERRVRAGRVSVRLNPLNPAQYRFERPFGPPRTVGGAVIE